MKLKQIVNTGLTVLISLAGFLYLSEANKPLTAKLKFKLSGRNLIDTDGFTTTDGYVVVYYTNDGGKTARLLGQTETISNKKNPDWNKTFEFHFDRRIKQYWYFHVYDEDNFRWDDMGRVWVKVEDYVDKNELANSNLDKGGYLTIRSSTAILDPEADSEEYEETLERSALKKRKVPTGILPFRHGTPNSKKLRFTVAVRGIMRNRSNHMTLVVTQAEGVNGAENFVGKSTIVTAGLNPKWDDIFVLNWSKVKDQRLHFRVYDTEKNTKKKLKDDDIVANAWIEVNDYIGKGEEFTVLLPDKGILTMAKVKSKTRYVKPKPKLKPTPPGKNYGQFSHQHRF